MPKSSVWLRGVSELPALMLPVKCFFIKYNTIISQHNGNVKGFISIYIKKLWTAFSAKNRSFFIIIWTFVIIQWIKNMFFDSLLSSLIEKRKEPDFQALSSYIHFWSTHSPLLLVTTKFSVHQSNCLRVFLWMLLCASSFERKSLPSLSLIAPPVSSKRMVYKPPL